MQISFIILFMIELYKDNHVPACVGAFVNLELYKDNHVPACVRACVCAFVNFFLKKKNFSDETIDWTFTKFHSIVP